MYMYIYVHICTCFPSYQTIFSCRGSGGFGKDAGGCSSPPREFCLLKFVVKINVLSTFCQKLNVF